MHLEELDPRDDEAFAAWYAVADACHRHDRPGDPGWLPHELRAFALAGLVPEPESLVPMLLARDGEQVVGAARLELPQRDNLHLAELLLLVHPDHRRRGVGRALLAHAEGLARAAGRTTVITQVDEPPGGAAPVPGVAFAAASGYSHGQTEVRRDLALPLDAARIAALEQACAPYAEGYALRAWQGRCPDELVDDRAHLMRRMSTDAPTGDVDWQEEEWDAARVRQREELVVEQKRTFFTGGAVHEASGRMVAFTDVGVPMEAPERAYQWETLVLAEHRGRRLGTLVKIACLRALTEAFPQTRFVSTWNAEENAPMIAVNEALGMRPNGALSIWQRVLAE